ncbi:hypothetical protein SLEP1_g54688 [Rubroshorea leprosula]|uniref:Uncharacterized protein n=1 Tax=Rubroshorea leprosula TaxID=152421 RepID=A0AAV5MFQ7_9ROSI|nr:hypothetical protein SLEP1_g54688 [Rubroshorea leprosula]
MTQQTYNGPHLSSTSQIPKNKRTPVLQRSVHPRGAAERGSAWLSARKGGRELIKIRGLSPPKLNNWWQITPLTHFTRKSTPQLTCSGKSAPLLTLPLTFNSSLISPSSVFNVAFFLLRWRHSWTNTSKSADYTNYFYTLKLFGE